MADGAARPNILIIWGDDVGMWNISAYHPGMMGGSTPNIDRIADEVMIFMEFYCFTETTLHGLRNGDWKVLLKTQDRWFNGFQQKLTTPLITNLKLDPFERFHKARGFDEWQENLATLHEFPPRMRSFGLDVDELLNQLNPARHR
ncbi:hypothetical protein [Mycobacterium gastri]|nr:hypothetical protein [Mycobacterium gastri]